MISDEVRLEADQLSRHVRARARDAWELECRLASRREPPITPRQLAELRGCDYRALLRALVQRPALHERDGMSLASLVLLARACDVLPMELLAGASTVIASGLGVVGPLAAAADRTNP